MTSRSLALSQAASSLDTITFPGIISDKELRLRLDKKPAAAGWSPAEEMGQMLLTRRSLTEIDQSDNPVAHVIFVSSRGFGAGPVLSGSVLFQASLPVSDVALGDPVVVHLRRISHRAARCLSWEKQSRRWSEHGCLTVEANATHVGCSCQRLTRYTLSE